MTYPVGDAPDGAYTVGSRYGQDQTEAGIKTQLRTASLGGFTSAQASLWSGGFVSALIGAITQGFAFTLGGISTWFGSLLGTVDKHTTDLAVLQDTTQKLQGVIGYAYGYVAGGWSGNINVVKRPVDSVIGPTVGVTRASGAYYLGSKGLWEAAAMFTVNQAGLLVGVDTELQIRVYSPSGSLYAIKSNLQSTDARHTLTVVMPFVVPSAGYYMELWTGVAAARDVIGGSQYSGFSVRKVSSETT
jgi:hypothetical protein